MSEIQLSVRIRPAAHATSPCVDVFDGSSPSKWKTPSPKVVVLPSKESFDYPSHVVKGSDQVLAFEALSSKLMDRARGSLPPMKLGPLALLLALPLPLPFL